MLKCCCTEFLLTPYNLIVLHPTPLEQQIEQAKQDAENAARIQAAEEAVKAMDEQRKKAQEAADKGLSTSPNDRPVGGSPTWSSAGAGADISAASSAPSEASSGTADETADGTKEATTVEDSGDRLIEDLLDDRPNYFMPFPDPDGGV